MKRICIVCGFILSLLAFCSLTIYAQDSAKVALVKTMIASKKFVFEVQSVTPLKGGTRQLTYGYTLKVEADKLMSDLPYFGRAYQASPGSSDGGMKFTSKQFEYSSTARKKNGWDIIIKPKDVSNVQQLSLTVFDNGSTTLRVSCNDRDPISYSGYLDTKSK
jgi:hypothetical protein